MLTQKNYLIKIIALCFIVPYYIYGTASHITLRSQSRNSARTYALWDKPREFTPDKVTGSLGIIGQFSNSFKKNKMARSLFGSLLEIDDDEKLILQFAGSRAEDRPSNAILADYLYLPTDFESSATVHPTVKTCIVSPYFRLNLDAWHPGLYIKIDSSIVHTKSHVHFKETVTNPGVNRYLEGYFVGDDSLIRTKLLEDATSYFAGNQIDNMSQTIFEPLLYGRINPDGQKRNGVADTYLSAGWDHAWSSYSGIGIAGHVGLPTGNRIQSTYLLAPTIGNGHHWELGGSINGYYTAWHNEETDHSLSFVGDVYIGHLFTCEQKRTFDLNNRPLSRYMLAMEFEKPALSENTLGTGVPGTLTESVVPFQFAQHYLPVANVTTLAVDVSASLQTDLVGMVNYSTQQWSFNAGFNVWFKSKDRISFQKPPTFNVALKGDAQMYGFVDGTPEAIVLSASQNNATLFSGLRFTKNTPPFDTSVLQNNAIDNPGTAVIQDFTQDPPEQSTGLVHTPNQSAANANERIKTSNPPLFLTMNDLDIESAETRSSSCKLFYNAQYSINTESAWKPTIGFGGEVEWGHGKNGSTRHSKSSFSQWSIWAHCSFGF